MFTHERSESQPPARVVILGANGFVPKALQRQLSLRGWPFLAIGSDALDLTSDDAAKKLGALLRSDDAVVMTAALTPEKGRDVATLIRNLRMAEAVVQAISAQPVAHLVYFSSDAVYDPREPMVSETTATAPTDLYGIMHLAREVALASAFGKSAVPYCILRPCAIYGVGDTHNSYGPNRFIRGAMTQGIIRLFGAGEETRDHVAIDDVVNLTLRTLGQRSAGTLNLVSGQARAFGDVARLVASLANKPVTIETQPRSGPVTHRAFAVDCLREAFPDFSPTPLEAGLRTTMRASVTPT